MRCALLVLAFSLAACRGHSLTADHAHHRFSNADDWARRFEDPARDAWQRPDEVVRLLALKDDAVVADIGAATGYFPVRVARVVPQGRVYGVDVESSMVDYLKARAERENLGNLRTVLAALDDPKLPEAVDLVMLVNTYHHLQDRPAYFARLTEKVKPGGRLVIIDFRKNSSMGPPASAKLDPSEVTAELAQAGWVPSHSHQGLPEQYFLEFKRP
jgi:cyclopropane fatty-acyl-phospholipid synthase-like methyltransferase